MFGFLNKKGFTMIEILVSITIIAITASLLMIATGRVRANAHDSQRIADINEIQTALERYATDVGSYPSVLVPGQSLTNPTSGKVYLKKIPSNPTPWVEGACATGADYAYSSNGGTSYTITYCLAAGSKNISAGYNQAFPGVTASYVGCAPDCSGNKICGSDSCVGSCGACAGGTACSNDQTTCLAAAVADCSTAVCGDCSATACGSTCSTTVTREGSSVAESYGTAQIGAQCWLTKNVNVGSVLAAANTYPSNDSVVERWCYGNNTDNCATDGALYAWSEAMNLPAACNSSGSGNCAPSAYVTGGSGAAARRQGVCPKGWHVPSDYEVWVLENYLESDISQGEYNYFYADQSGSDTLAWRGESADWSSPSPIGPGAQLMCLGSKSPVASCTAAAGSATAPKLPLAGFGEIIFQNRGSQLHIISSSQYSASEAWTRVMSGSRADVLRTYTHKTDGNSLRCLKD